MVDNAPSVGILRCSKNLVDARDKNIQQRAESLSLAGALRRGFIKSKLKSCDECKYGLIGFLLGFVQIKSLQAFTFANKMSNLCYRVIHGSFLTCLTLYCNESQSIYFHQV